MNDTISTLEALCDRVLAENKPVTLAELAQQFRTLRIVEVPPVPEVGECEGWLSYGNSPTNEDGYECPRSGKLRRNGQILCDECWENTPREFRK